MPWRLFPLPWLLALALAAPAVSQDRIPADERPTECPVGGPLQVWLLLQSSATDCDDTVSGTVDALCCCVNNTWAACATASGGSGTVTSVGLAVPAEWSVAGSPVTTSGTITISEATQADNTFYSGPASLGPAAPSFRAILDSDVPNTITVNLATSASDLTCTNCIGGTEIDESTLGAVPTATALAANPTDCSVLDGTEAAVRINASGNLLCAQVAFTSETIDRDSSATTIVSSTTETAIYSYTVPAGTVGADGELRLTLVNEWFNNSGASRSVKIRVKLGGTTVIDFDTGAFGAYASRRRLQLSVLLSAHGATNAQDVTLWGHIPNASAFGTVTTGTGYATTGTSTLHLSSGDLTQDMTTSKVLEVSIQFAVSHASLEWKTTSGTLELLQP